jgi:F-type H+-transporting ATPase subunit b
MSGLLAAGGLALALAAAPAYAQPADRAGRGSEPEPAAAGAAGSSAQAHEPNAERPPGEQAGEQAHGPAGEAGEAGEEELDPSKHFNYLGIQPGHLFDYRGKDELGGPLGDSKMTDPATGQVVHEEEPASPPFVFVLINFAILLGLLAWRGWPLAQKVARERHDLIKTALDEAARLRKQAADKLADYEARLKAADAEIRQLVDGMRADADKEKQRILAAAEAQAAQMARDAEQRIAAEIELARAQLTREVTAAAAAATEKLLRDKLTAGDQQQLVAGFITDVRDVRDVRDVQGAGRGVPRGRGEVQ